jgi:hypothetical protein
MQAIMMIGKRNKIIGVAISAIGIQVKSLFLQVN